MFSILFFILLSEVLSKGGAPKCISCPSCMICDPLIGCTYDNFSPCTNIDKKGYCVNGFCNTTIVNSVPFKPPVCKTFKFTRTVVNGTSKITTSLANNINGLSCTQLGAILESVCIKGVCTPYTLGIDRLGQPTGCRGLPNGFMCDTNFVFTDGEKCMNETCVMPSDPLSLCPL